MPDTTTDRPTDVRWGVLWPGTSYPEDFGPDEQHARAVADRFRDDGAQLSRKVGESAWQTVTDLYIPDEALTGLALLLGSGVYDDAELVAAVRKLAAPVVAAYLRQLTTLRPFAGVQRELWALADKLDGGDPR